MLAGTGPAKAQGLLLLFFLIQITNRHISNIISFEYDIETTLLLWH